MNGKRLLILLVILSCGCAPSTVSDFTATAAPPAAASPLPLPSDLPAETATLPPPPAEMQLLAYLRDGQLLVTDVTNAVHGGTTQYTVSRESDQVTDLAWSPSGAYLAFVSAATGTPRLYYVFAGGQSTPTDLGPGSAPAWSPDSSSIAYVGGMFPDENIWITAIANPSPRQLTFETNYAWGRPVYTPDGLSLIVAGTDRDNMGASGNTTFVLESLALDGSGSRAPLPGAAPFEGGRLPYDLHFSPDGSRLAFSTSFHLSACASPGAYFVSNPDGSDRRELVSPSLQAAVDPQAEHYHVGLSYAWRPAGDGIVALGTVVDCSLESPIPGRVLAGPQMSSIGLDGTETLVIPGFFHGISVDRTGMLIAAAHFLEGFQDLNPNVVIYSGQSGQLLLPLGPGSNPRFQP